MGKCREKSENVGKSRKMSEKVGKCRDTVSGGTFVGITLIINRDSVTLVGLVFYNRLKHIKHSW